MTDVAYALLEYRGDAVDAGMLPLCYRKSLSRRTANQSPAAREAPAGCSPVGGQKPANVATPAWRDSPPRPPRTSAGARTISPEQAKTPSQAACCTRAPDAGATPGDCRGRRGGQVLQGDDRL